MTWCGFDAWRVDTADMVARPAGIEPAFPGWRPGVLPLDDGSVGAVGRIRTAIFWLEAKGPTLERRQRVVVETRGVEPLPFGCGPKVLPLSPSPHGSRPRNRTRRALRVKQAFFH